MKLRTMLRLPKEHGAWAMLYVPFLVGALAGSSSSSSPFQLLLLLLSATFVFIARQSFVEWRIALSRGLPGAAARRTLLVYAGLGGALGVPLVFLYQRVWLVPAVIFSTALLALNSWQAVRREDRTIIGEMIAIVGLTLTAPAAYYVCRGELNGSAWLLWALCILYFAASVFYVKLRVHSLNRRREGLRKRARRYCALYHLFLIAALVLLGITGSTSVLVLVAFAPVLAKTVLQLAKPSRQISLRQIGVLEIVYSVVF